MRPAPLAAVCASLAAATAAALLACSGDEATTGGALPTGTAAVAARVAAAFYHPPTNRIPHELATNPGTPWGDYLGSPSCQACHATEFAKWRDSFHSRTLYDAVPATVFGNFSGDVVFEDREYPYTARPFRVGDKMFVEIGRNPSSPLPEDTYGAGLPPDRLSTFEVIYSFGNRRHQPYVVRAKDGGHWVLPVFWNDVHKGWRYSGWRPYTVTCANCHVTGIKSLDEGTRREMLAGTNPTRWSFPPPNEGWAEGAVGCETCHGPGRPHVEAVNRMGVEAYRAHLAAGGKRTIYAPKHDTRERRMQQCDSCHTFDSESSVTWVPTPDGYTHEMWQRPLEPKASNAKGQFYGDGTDMSPCTVGTVFRKSKMGRHHSGIECSTCHDPHGTEHWADLRLPITENQLCLSCHGREYGDEAALVRHTHHGPKSPGSRCAECHMPRDKRFTNGIQVMSDRLPSHAFSVPRGEEPPNGAPSSCNVCHVDKDAAWVRAVLDAWKAGRPPPR